MKEKKPFSHTHDTQKEVHDDPWLKKKILKHWTLMGCSRIHHAPNDAKLNGRKKEKKQKRKKVKKKFHHLASMYLWRTFFPFTVAMRIRTRTETKQVQDFWILSAQRKLWNKTSFYSLNLWAGSNWICLLNKTNKWIQLPPNKLVSKHLQLITILLYILQLIIVIVFLSYIIYSFN